MVKRGLWAGVGSALWSEGRATQPVREESLGGEKGGGLSALPHISLAFRVQQVARFFNMTTWSWIGLNLLFAVVTGLANPFSKHPFHKLPPFAEHVEASQFATKNLQAERGKVRSMERLVTAIEAQLPKLMHTHDVDGAAVGLVYNGRPFYQQGFGIASITTGAKYKPDTTISQQVWCALKGIAVPDECFRFLPTQPLFPLLRGGLGFVGRSLGGRGGLVSHVSTSMPKSLDCSH